jgi:hypothetical protein
MKDEIEKILGRALNDKIEAVWNVEDGKVSLETATQDIMALIKKAVPEKESITKNLDKETASDQRILITFRQGFNNAIDQTLTNLGVEDENN